MTGSMARARCANRYTYTVEDALSEEILSGDIKLGDKVRGQVVDGKLCFERCPVEMAVV